MKTKKETEKKANSDVIKGIDLEISKGKEKFK
jgi:hypothetical protein